MKPSEIDFKTKLDVWKQHQEVAIHFNDLILKVRTQALGAVAALITIGGVLLGAENKLSSAHWGVMSAVFLFLSMFWLAIWILDFKYYNRLLLGAVDSILNLERELNQNSDSIQFGMSHKIRESVLYKCKVDFKADMMGPKLFYVVVMAVLTVSFIVSGVLCYVSWKG